MRFYQKYLNKKEILERTKKYGFPHAKFVELLVWDYEIFRQLLAISDGFVLRGGAAAQLYLHPEQQRASIDIDLITKLDAAEIDRIMKQLGGLDPITVKRYTPTKAVKPLPLITYLVDLPSSIVEGGSCQIKVDISYENIEDYKLCMIGNKELFALKIEEGLPCIKLGSLIGDKLLTLAGKTIGIDETREDQLPKHVYDLSRLIGLMDKEAYGDMLYSFERIAKTELKIKNLKYTLDGIIEDCEEVLREFADIDTKDKRFKKLAMNFQTTYVSKTARSELKGWSIGSLRLRYLLKTIKQALADPAEQEKGYLSFRACEDRLAQINNRGIEEKKAAREELLQEAKKKMWDWKYLNGKSEERIFLEILQK